MQYRLGKSYLKFPQKILLGRNCIRHAEIFFGKISDQEIENFLLSLSGKGETSDELTGAVLAMRAASLKVDLKRKIILLTVAEQEDLEKV